MSTRKCTGSNICLCCRFAVAGIVAVASIVAFSAFLPLQAFAHSEHGAAPDLEIRSGETDGGDLYFRLTVDHGKKVSGALNGPVHIHSGRPHLIRFMNEGEIDHEVHFGRNPDIEARLYGVNLFGSSTDEHVAHGVLGVHLNPGESVVLHVWIPEGKEGEWEIGCFVPGHYEMGQKAPFHVISEDGGDDHHESTGESERHEGAKSGEKHHAEEGEEHHENK